MTHEEQDNARNLSGGEGREDEPGRDLDALLKAYAQHQRDQGLPMIPERREPRGSVIWRLVPLGVVAALVFLILGYRIQVTRESSDAVASQDGVPIAAARLDSGTIEGLDHRGQRIWIRGFPGTVREPWVVRDTKGGIETVAVSVLEGTQSHLYALDPATGESVWSRPADFARSGVTTGPFIYTDAGWGGWDQTLFATVIAGSWYLSGIQLLDATDGDLRGVYYHPGHLFYGPLVDLDQDGTPSLVLYGDNSSARFDPEFVSFETARHCGAVVLLDQDGFEGQAYPYSRIESRPDWPEVLPARERAYLCIAPIDDTIDANVAKVSVAPGEADRPGVIEARLTDGRIVLMDGELRPYRVFLILDYPAEERDREERLESRFLYIVRGQERILTLPVAPLVDLPENWPPAPDSWG